MRLNKYLSDAGVCSRREADRLTEAGEITINGKRAETGMQVEPGDVVVVKGKTVVPEEKKVYLAFNKPRGIVCTAEKREKNNVIDYLSYPVRIYPVGRLDKDSEGLLLMTNDGAIVNGIMRARNRHEKEYQVEVNKETTPEFLKKMASGVPILDTVTRPCRIQKTGERSFTIILTQGLNRQIRRMCEALGYRVTKLKRVRIMNIHLKDLKTGEYRPLTEKELAELNHEEQRQRAAVNETKIWLEHFNRRRITVKQLTREALVELVDKIYVYPEQKIDIYFKFASVESSPDRILEKDGVI